MGGLIKDLEEYRSRFPMEGNQTDAFLQFIKSTPKYWSRSNSSGHVTSSAWILSPDKSAALLTLHAKLKMWLQPGGHSDCDNIPQNALREAQEESGIADLFIVQKTIFDIDAHTIPANSKEAEHIHWDIRYLLQSKTWDFQISEESLELKWIPLEEMENFVNKESILRMVAKVLVG